jgi:hypothetical protein
VVSQKRTAMSGFDLQAFLADQRSEGVQEAKEGSFTVAREKALTKLAHYALPDEFSWALKIVQAANCWEADLLEIVQSRVATSFYFNPKDPSNLPTDEEIISALQSGTLNGPIGLLGMALCSLVQQANLSFVLAVRRGADTQKPIYAGDDTSALNESTREKWTAMSRPGIRLTVSHFRASESWMGRYTPTVAGVPRRDVEIVRCLEEKAFASHTAITVDRRLLSSVSCSKLGMFEAIYRPFLSGRFDQQSLDVVTHSPMPDRHAFSKIRLAPPNQGPHFLVCSLEWRVQRALATGEGPFAGLPYPPRHRVYWVRHGVIVADKSIHNSTSGTTFCLFLSADEHRSDLTGLAIDFADDEKARVVRYASLATQALEEEGAKFLADIENLDSADIGTWSFVADQEASISVAGFSVASESLLSIVQYARSVRDKAIEALNELVQLPGSRHKLINQWRPFVLADIRGVRKDVARFGTVAF